MQPSPLRHLHLLLAQLQYPIRCQLQCLRRPESPLRRVLLQHRVPVAVAAVEAVGEGEEGVDEEVAQALRLGERAMRMGLLRARIVQTGLIHEWIENSMCE